MNPQRKSYLRDTFTAGTTEKFNLQKLTATKDADSDHQETITKFTSANKSQKRQTGSPSRLRCTYSPATFSSKYLADKPKLDTNQNWRSTARLTGFSPSISIRRSSEVINNEKGLSKLESQLQLLGQRVHRAIKQLTSKNSKKSPGDQLRCIAQGDQQEVVETKQLEKTQNRSKSKTSNRSKTGQTNRKTPSDMKATLKIPELSKLVSTLPKPKQAFGFTTNPYSPRQHNIYYVSELVRALRQQNSLAKEHVRSSIKILKTLQHVPLPPIGERMLNLKKSQFYQGKKTLVFDLDQTLIHCNEYPDTESDVKLSIILQSGDTFEAGINIRPYALTLLQNLYKKFELILFTASHSSYANVVIDYIDPDKKLFQHRLFRQHCYYSPVGGMYVKDLRIINRRLSDMVLIDNAAYSYAFQLDNGIPILSYYQGQDFQLKALQKYLERVHGLPDVRQLNKQTFKLHHYTKFGSPEQLVQQLYMDN